MNTVSNNSNFGVGKMSSLYESTRENIELILKKRYKMTVRDAKEAIAISPLKSVFDENAEMAAHTSNEEWARRINDYWKKNSNNN